jgi:hypothetical protein
MAAAVLAVAQTILVLGLLVLQTLVEVVVVMGPVHQQVVLMVVLA